MLEVTIYDAKGNKAGEFLENDDTDVDYVSLISSETYGPPALVAPTPRGDGPKAAPGDRVLYINTSLVPMFRIVRQPDGD